MENNINLKNLKVDQLGYVYKDIEKQVKIMESFPETQKFVVFQAIELDVIYRGVKKTIKLKAAFGRMFDTELELLQPLEGNNIYTEFLDRGKEGLHHICYKVESLNEIINKFKNKGIEILQSGKVVRLKYAYMDTEEILGIIVEFSEESKRVRRKKQK